MKTIVYPDMIEAAFATDEIDLFNSWLVFKAIDQNSNNGVGSFSKEAALDIFAKWSKMAKSTAYRALVAGNGSYWKIAGDKVYLRGIAKVCEHLGIKILNKRGFEVDLESLCQSKGDNRAYLMGIMIAGADTPQSYTNIAERCNICRRTVISYVNKCSHIRTMPNYTVISKHNSRSEVLDAIADIRKENPQESERYQPLRDSGGYYVGYRLPNSFISELDISRTKTKKKINKKIGDGNPGFPTDFRGAPLNSRTFEAEKKKSPLKTTGTYYSYKATVKEVIVGENNMRDEMRIWTDEESN